MTTLIILGILFLIVSLLLLGVNALLVGLSLKIYTEMAKERSMQIRANLTAAGIPVPAEKGPKPAHREVIT